MNSSVRLCIADVCFSVYSSIGDILPESDPAYHSFLGISEKKKETIDIKVRLQPESLIGSRSLEDFQKIFDSEQSWSMFRDGTDYWIVLQPPAFQRPVWKVRFQMDMTDINVYCGPKLYGDWEGNRGIANPVRYPLDQLLLMYSLARHGGTVIHAAGIRIDGKGYIFPGPSGAGKSTLIRQIKSRKNFEVFSDDRMVVRKINKNYIAFGTPWPGEEGSAVNKAMPLWGIFFLVQDTSDWIERIRVNEAMERLLKVMSVPWFDREVMPEVLSFCDELITKVPLYELHFTPGPGVVGILEKLDL